MHALTTSCSIINNTKSNLFTIYFSLYGLSNHRDICIIQLLAVKVNKRCYYYYAFIYSHRRNNPINRVEKRAMSVES